MSSERTILESLDEIVHSPAIQTRLQPIVSRLQQLLTAQTHDVMVWEPIDLSTFDGPLPDEVRSAWVFILREGVNTGAERHPNSHQRMMSFAGSGDLQTRADLDGPWNSNILVSDPTEPLEQRWISIPPNVWHQPITPPGQNWVVVSFHTVPADELIEERPDPTTAGGTKQMLYMG